MSILNNRPKNPTIKSDTILKIRVIQSILKYNVTSIKNLNKEHVNVLIKIFKELNKDYNKRFKNE